VASQYYLATSVPNICAMAEKHSQRQRSRAWTFTLNNPDAFRPQYNEDKHNYLIYQLEQGENGTPHLQGYVNFKNPQALSALQKYIPSGHFEVALGSPQQNKIYCSKEPRLEDTVEFGEIPQQGKRNDLDAVVETIKNSKRPLSAVIEEHPVPFIKYSRGIEKMCNYYLEKNTREFRTIQVEVYWGKTGTGKTRKAVEENPDNFILRNFSKDIWFDGYTGQSVLIIDEFKNWITLTYLLALLDGYQCPLPIKGSLTYAQWTKVIITSNLNTDEWFPNIDEEHKKALERRITNKIHFDSL